VGQRGATTSQTVLAPRNKASEDDPNLLYDGVADTLVSLLLRNAQQLLAKNSRFRIDSPFVED
jgi:hypothetical protein